MAVASITSPLQDRRFLMLGSLGRGGLGEVYRAFDRAERRLVALKTHSVPVAPGPGHPLSEEFDALSRLCHPNVVRAYELRLARRGPLHPRSPYLVMEHVDGLPAHRALPPGRTPPALLVSAAVGLLRGLRHVHRAGMVHRDLKPANVLVARTGRRLDSIKLTDFGLAVPAGRAEPPGTMSGSLLYVAPEALLGAALDGRADLYAAGLLLYRLATGESAVPTSGVGAALRWHLAGPPADAARLRPKLPGRLGRLIRRLTARDRDRRPSSADEALAMLGLPESRSFTERGGSRSRIA